MKKLYVPSPEQKESARHGETLFPMQKYITKLDLVYPVVTTHWHEEAELTLITEGEGLYQIDLVDYEVKKGDILFVPPLLLHSVSLAQPQNEGDDFRDVCISSEFSWRKFNRYLFNTLLCSYHES